jgi:hypothetical protein
MRHAACGVFGAMVIADSAARAAFVYTCCLSISIYVYMPVICYCYLALGLGANTFFLFFGALRVFVFGNFPWVWVASSCARGQMEPGNLSTVHSSP